MVVRRIIRTTGKWGRAIGIVGDMQVAQETASIEEVEDTGPNADVLSTAQNDNIVDLYSVGHEEVTRRMCNMGVEVPFQHMLSLLGPQGEVVRVSVLFDGCTMVSAMCTTIFKQVQHKLGNWRSSEKRLRMGNGTIVLSLAVWKGRVQLGGVIVEGEFKVFDSRAAGLSSWGNHYYRCFVQSRHMRQTPSVFRAITTKNYSMRSKALRQGGTDQELTSP